MKEMAIPIFVTHFVFNSEAMNTKKNIKALNNSTATNGMDDVTDYQIKICYLDREGSLRR